MLNSDYEPSDGPSFESLVSRPTAAHVTRHRDANVRIPGLTQEFVHCLICLSSSFLSNIVEYGEYLKLWRILVSQTRHIEKEEECYISECQDLTFLYSHFYRLYINVWISCVDFHYHLASEKHIFLIDENVAVLEVYAHINSGFGWTVFSLLC